MKNTRAIVMLLLALLLGALAVVLVARWLGQQGDIATNQVVTATRDIQLGTELTPDMLATTSWPIGSTPPNGFNDVNALQSRVLKIAVLRGEPIVESKLAAVGTKGGLSAVIGDGKRAITVKVNEVIGVAGFALPGSHVDIMVNTEDEQKRMISKIVLERILVLAVAQEAGRDETKPKVVNAVTLEVKPEEAEKIDLARSIGNLSLVLRNQIDQNETPTTGMRKSDLLGETLPAPKPVAEGKPAVRRPSSTAPKTKGTVEIIKGLVKSQVEF